MTQKTFIIQPIDVRLVNPHTGTEVTAFIDSGSLQQSLAKQFPNALPLMHFIPDVAETDQWQPQVWLVWTEALQRLAGALSQSTESETITKPASDLTAQERLIPAMTQSVQNGVMTATFTAPKLEADPERDQILARLSELHTFIQTGLTQQLSLRNQIVFTRPPQEEVLGEPVTAEGVVPVAASEEPEPAPVVVASVS